LPPGKNIDSISSPALKASKRFHSIRCRTPAPF